MVMRFEQGWSWPHHTQHAKDGMFRLHVGHERVKLGAKQRLAVR